MRLLRKFWNFLGQYQTAAVRWLHAAVVIGVIVQLLNSNGMAFNRTTGAVLATPIAEFSTWLHIGLGLTLAPLTLVFIAVAIGTHGLRHYFPYLWGDLTQAKADLAASLQLRLAEPQPGGLASIVTGLGFGALLLAVGSGSVWFLLWRNGSAFTHSAKEVHETLVGLIEVYFVGHGSMAMLHFLSWLKTARAHPAPERRDER
ncbi:MAG: cytochrome b/b6 domain-containing protein [Burkholderiaceae bacterium]